jgi:hypothetical protein
MKCGTVPFFFPALFISVLLFLCPSVSFASEPFETVYLLPEESIEVKAGLEAVDNGSGCLAEYIGFALGVSEVLTFRYSFTYVSSYLGKRGVSGPGDSYPSIRWYLGGWDRVHVALSAGLTLPTGGNVYRNVDWAGLSLGNSELFSGLDFRYDLSRFVFGLSSRYTFRQAADEEFFSLRFFGPSRLKNDYCGGSLSVMALHFYPLTVYASVSASVRVWTRSTPQDRLPAEGCGVNPVPLSIGARWFFSRDVFLAVYYTEEAVRYAGFPRRRAGCAFSILF